MDKINLKRFTQWKKDLKVELGVTAWTEEEIEKINDQTFVNFYNQGFSPVESADMLDENKELMSNSSME